MKKVNNLRKSLTLAFLFAFVSIQVFTLGTLVQARDVDVMGFHVTDKIYVNETVNYQFNNSIILSISTNVFLDFEADFENKIENRQIFFQLQNDQSIKLNITSKSNMGMFGIPNAPPAPRQGNYQYQNRYNCIFLIRANTSIQSLTIKSNKEEQFGFNPDRQYSLALLNPDQESWELIELNEVYNTTSASWNLETSLSDLTANTNYYITFFEINPISDNFWWIGLIIGLSIGILALIVVISKRDYIQLLIKRTIPIEKGAHRLSIEDVLENENRGKILELILNEPGIHFNELLRQTGLAAGNLVWHLDILETYKVIGKKRIGRYIAYFPYYQKNPISNLDLKLSKSKLTLEVLEMIESEPGLWNSAITRRMKVDHKTINYHVEKLKELGLIILRKEGRKKKIYPNFDSEYFNQKNNHSEEG
jgi:predicted transcriptional regulator